MVVLQSLIGRVTGLVAQLVGLGIFAAVLAAAAAVVHRWYVREGIARALSLLVGLSGIAVYLNTTTALGTVIAGSSAPTETQVALFNISAFIVGAGGALLGRTVGDRFGTDVLLGEGFADMEADVGRLVQSVGRVVVVELPTEIDDTVGYDPVAAETKEELAGKRFVFPRRLTIGELRERLVTRLKADYGVGHVDVELDDDGTVEYLALGSRAAGIGPTLPPATNAVVIRADPAFAASAGDLVQVWETDPMRRVLTAELRGVSEDTVTIAIDAADTQKVDPTREYRLVTLPVEDRPDREFASLLRAAEETFSSVTVEAGSPLHGMPVGALDFTVVALKPEGEQPRAIPDRTTVLAPGDVVFAIARPEQLRRLEAAARPLDPSLVSSPVPQQRSQPATGDTPADDDAPGSNQTADDSDDLTTDHSSDGQPAPDHGLAGDDATADETGVPDETETLPTEAANGPSDDAPEDDTEPESAPLAGDSDGTDSEGPAAPDPDGTDDAEPASATADDGEDGQSGGVGSSSFQQLKAEFESGEADWADEDERPPSEDASATADGTADADSEDAAFEGNGVDTLDVGDEDTGDDPDGLDDDEDIDGLALEEATETGSDTVETDSGGLDSGVGLEDASFGDEDDSESEEDGDDGLANPGFDDDDGDGLDELSFEGDDGDDDDDDELDELSFDDDDDDELDELSFDDDEDNGDDDLSSLSFDDDDTEEEFSLDDDNGDTEDKSDGDSDEDAEDKSDGDDDDDGGGGAASFQQLKEEFESGDADWEDDISDSPGGDMRLDE